MVIVLAIKGKGLIRKRRLEQGNGMSTLTRRDMGSGRWQRETPKNNKHKEAGHQQTHTK